VAAFGLAGGLLLACSAVVGSFDIARSGLDARGLTLVAYNLARLGLAALIGWAVYACGKALARDAELPATLVIGFCVLSMAMFGLGVLDLYYKAVAIALMAALFAIAAMSRHTPANPKCGFATTAKDGAAVAALVVLAVFLGLVLFANRALFIGETDNDVWEHYLHYYDAVVQAHSVRPNDLWVHFYVSKAAGGFFLAALLGDVFSVQLVSWLCVLFIALIAHVMVRSSSDSKLAGLAAAALVLASWNAIGGESGSMLKHHTVVAALMTSLFWCGYEGVVRRARCDPRIIMLAGIAAAFYLGLYITVAAGIAAAGLVAMAVYFALFPRLRSRAWMPVLLGGGAVLGGAAALAINYAWTGLALDAPVGIFWPFADRERFAKLWSPLVVEYWFLGPASVESAKLTISGVLALDWNWWARLLRAPYLRPVWIAAALFAAAAVAWRFAGKGQSRGVSGSRDATMAIGAIGAFVFGGLVVSQLFRNSESVYRLYAFLLPLVICALVLVWQSAARMSGEADRAPVRWLLVLTAALCALQMLRQVPAARWQAVWSHVSGTSSARDVLKQAEQSFPGRIPVDFMVEFRRQVGDSRRILSLTYDPAPAYFLPGPPVVSEPSYAFGARYEELLFSGRPERTEQLLKDAGIGYVAINLRNRLFLGLPYTELFSAQEMQARLGLVWERDGVFLLGWRSDGAASPLPEAFLKAMEAKKTGVIPADAEALWGKDTAAYMRRASATRDQNSSYLKWLYDEMRARSRGASGR
jgi:hypothetical protein